MSFSSMSGLPTLSPDFIVGCSTRPLSRLRIVVRTNAEPLPGLTCWNLDDLERLAVDLDLEALAELGRIDDTGHGTAPSDGSKKSGVSSRCEPLCKGESAVRRRRVDAPARAPYSSAWTLGAVTRST